MTASPASSPAESFSSTNTMLSVALPHAPRLVHAPPQHYAPFPQHHHAYAMPHRQPAHSHQHQQLPPAWGPKYAADVTQALNVARDDHEGPLNPEITDLLDAALEQLWRRVLAQPDSYVMTRDEYALFNYFQSRFVDNKLAIGARQRFWDSSSA